MVSGGFVIKVGEFGWFQLVFGGFSLFWGVSFFLVYTKIQVESQVTKNLYFLQEQLYGFHFDVLFNSDFLSYHTPSQKLLV